jgi:hypothetical protein
MLLVRFPLSMWCLMVIEQAEATRPIVILEVAQARVYDDVGHPAEDRPASPSERTLENELGIEVEVRGLVDAATVAAHRVGGSGELDCEERNLRYEIGGKSR